MNEKKAAENDEDIEFVGCWSFKEFSTSGGDEMKDIPPELIFNRDQTRTEIVPTSMWKKGMLRQLWSKTNLQGC